MKTPNRCRFRPAVEHSSRSSLMSAIPGVDEHPAVQAAQAKVVRIHGTVEGPITAPIRRLPVRSTRREADNRRSLGSRRKSWGSSGSWPNTTIGGSIEFQTDRGAVCALVTSQSSYKIYAGTDHYARATGEGTFHLNDPSAGKIRFLFVASQLSAEAAYDVNDPPVGRIRFLWSRVGPCGNPGGNVLASAPRSRGCGVSRRQSRNIKRPVTALETVATRRPVPSQPGSRE